MKIWSKASNPGGGVVNGATAQSINRCDSERKLGRENMQTMNEFYLNNICGLYFQLLLTI